MMTATLTNGSLSDLFDNLTSYDEKEFGKKMPKFETILDRLYSLQDCDNYVSNIFRNGSCLSLY